MTATSPQAPDPGRGEPDPARWRGLILCLVAGFMTLLDVSIVNVALPSIRSGLGATETDVQWVVAGYALAFGMVLVPAGRLGDARSRRAIFALGLASFVVASMLCGLAPTAEMLAGARLLQGAAAGFVTPQVSGFIQTLFHGAERGKAFGYFGATIGVSTAIGPLLGGLLVEAGGTWGWRLVFFVNVPIGIVALALVRRLLPASERGPRQSVDPVGVVLFAATVLAVLFPLVSVEGTSLGQRPWWVALVALALLAAFVAWERGWAARGRATLVDLSLVHVRSYVLGIGIGALYFAGFTSVFLVLTLWLQEGLGYSPIEAGATQMAFAVGSGISSALAGRVVSRLGRPLVVAGLVVTAAGLVVLDLLLPHLDGSVGLKVAPVLFVTGFGAGMTISPNVTLTVSEVDVRHAGSAGGMLQTAQRVGTALGVALVAAQFFSVLADDGSYREALTLGLRTTIGFVLAALALGVVDVVTNRRRTD